MSILTSQKKLPLAHPQSWHVVALKWSSQTATGWFNIIQIQKMDEPSKTGRFDSHVIFCYEWAWSTFFCNNGSSRYVLFYCIYHYTVYIYISYSIDCTCSVYTGYVLYTVRYILYLMYLYIVYITYWIIVLCIYKYIMYTM